MKPRTKVVRAWALVGEDGKIAHHYESYAIHQFKHQAMANAFSDGSDRLIQVEIRPISKKGVSG